jgi:hypothetical protein
MALLTALVAHSLKPGRIFGSLKLFDPFPTDLLHLDFVSKCPTVHKAIRGSSC